MPEDFLKSLFSNPKIKLTATQYSDENGKEWAVIKWHQEDGVGWDWETMPEKVWEKYHRAKRMVEQMNGTFEYEAEADKRLLTPRPLYCTVIIEN